MESAGKWIARNRLLILLIGLILLVPAVFGVIKTRINYDLLSYLPESLETVEGQNIMVDEFGSGGFAMVVVDNMPLKDVQKLEKRYADIDHVAKTLWYTDVADLSIPVELLPKDLRESFIRGDSTMMLVLFDNTTSSDEAMEALEKMRTITDQEVFISGMTGIVTDIKNLCMQEIPIYVTIAAVLSLIVLIFATEYFLIPIIFLSSIGIAILYNLGSNIFLGQISYITQAVTAVLQLGVTMDYSIFLLNSYEENKLLYPESKEEAMGHAINSTFVSIVGSSVTTVAGFLALCVMTFALGMDLGIVMSKGVVIGVICCVTILPSLILFLDPLIEKTKHKPIFKETGVISNFITKHYLIWIFVFLALIVPATYGNNHVDVYYNIAHSLPADLDSNVANKKLKDTFDMNVMHVVMMDKNIKASDKAQMYKDIDKVDGVKWTIGLNSLVGSEIPEQFIPSEIKDMLQGDEHEIAFVCSEYESATPKVNKQIASIEKVVKGYDDGAVVIGEAPLMKDLEDTTNVDLKRVNFLSIAAIFVIIMLVFKSISLPIILVSVIELAINVNMAFPFYQGVSIPFVASIVIGTIQLGATVDYAILMTNRYQKERLAGVEKKEAVKIAHRTSIHSVITSGASFFAATFGVAVYSRVDMIGSICTLLSRGAIISVIVVLTVLPAMFMIFDKLICMTTLDFIRNRK
ncbi:MAG: MMPL family transporter [Eubacteriales bacterium]|nr:MMPL family transporter [Eubacteriales bacterium]